MAESIERDASVSTEHRRGVSSYEHRDVVAELTDTKPQNHGLGSQFTELSNSDFWWLRCTQLPKAAFCFQLLRSRNVADVAMLWRDFRQTDSLYPCPFACENEF